MHKSHSPGFASRTRSLHTFAIGVVALVTIVSCADQSKQLLQPATPDKIVICGDGCGGGGGPVDPPTVSVQLTPTTAATLQIDNRSSFVANTVVITNNGPTLNGFTLELYVTEGNVSHSVGVFNQLSCNGALAGTLPHGRCEFDNLGVSAMNADPGLGTYTPGFGTLRASVNAGNKSFPAQVPVTLTAGLVSARQSSVMNIEGVPVTWTLTLTNTGLLPVTNLSYRIALIQGSPTNVTRTLTTIPLQCAGIGAASGTLPGNSTCTMAVPITATNSAPGSGTLISGSGATVISLLQGTATYLQSTISGGFQNAHLSNVRLNDTTIVIGSTSHAFNATILNSGTTTAPLAIVGRIRQGNAQRTSVTAQIACGDGSANVGSFQCAVSGTYAADNTAPGTGTLTPGAAFLDLFVTLRATLHHTLEITSIPITLTNGVVAPSPAIGTLNVQGTPTIGSPGPSVPLAIALSNSGGATAGTTIRIQLQQGSTARDAGGGTLPLSCGAGAGVIPSGGCTLNTQFAASNIASGSGTFVARAATLGIIITDPIAGVIRKFQTVTLTTAP